MIVADPLFGERTAPALPAGSATRPPTLRDRLSTIYFTPLGGTAEEARAIKTLFPEAAVFSGSRASKAAVQRADAPRVLHIASHGFFLADASGASAGGGAAAGAGVDVENPLLRSGLALAGQIVGLHGGRISVQRPSGPSAKALGRSVTRPVGSGPPRP